MTCRAVPSVGPQDTALRHQGRQLVVVTPGGRSMVLVTIVKEDPEELATGWLMGDEFDDSSPLPLSFNTCSY